MKDIFDSIVFSQNGEDNNSSGKANNPDPNATKFVPVLVITPTIASCNDTSGLYFSPYTYVYIDRAPTSQTTKSTTIKNSGNLYYEITETSTHKGLPEKASFLRFDFNPLKSNPGIGKYWLVLPTGQSRYDHKSPDNIAREIEPNVSYYGQLAKDSFPEKFQAVYIPDPESYGEYKRVKI